MVIPINAIVAVVHCTTLVPLLNWKVASSKSIDALSQDLGPNLITRQAFINCMHGYDRICNVHGKSVTRTRKFMHGINSSV